MPDTKRVDKLISEFVDENYDRDPVEAFWVVERLLEPEIFYKFAHLAAEVERERG